ncbi:hypothetical protein OG21DRAFT_1506141 [Imleria badia]|nr:hypothetical protein OG21DRAFT_1506141 [Imleria badia]
MSSHSTGCMIMTTSDSDSVSEGQEFFNMFYIGINIENILYGIELFLFFKTIRILLSNRGTRKKKIILFYVLFSSTMVFTVTVWVATQAMFGQKLWLLDSDFPGGPAAYWRKNIAIWYIDWGTTAIVVLQLMTDALMIYRCWIIWPKPRIVVVPILLWLATLILGVAVDWTTSSPGGDYFTGVSTPLSLAYWSIAVFLTTSLTCIICYRLVRHANMVQEYLGNEYASSYFTIVTVIVESVLPYTLSGIAALVSLGAASPTSVMFVSVYFLMMCISPQMLILRVLAKTALGNNASSRPGSTVKFTPRSVDMSGPQCLESNGARLHVQSLSDVNLSDTSGKVRVSEV